MENKINTTTIIPNPTWGKVLELFQTHGSVRIDTKSKEQFEKLLESINIKYTTEVIDDLTRFTVKKS